jgi:two-component system CheB/CheR fusion protein
MELETELRDTKENLQTVIEEVESANEELQSTNEEIISANEELQSTNEELQSLNEELHTVNAEHQIKIKELLELNDDLNNYFINSDIGQILLDKDMNIRKFTPIATKQVNLIESDIGRPIRDISINFGDGKFILDIKQVLQTGNKIEKEIVMDENSIYLMKIAPYLRQDRSMDGVVVNFIDVTQLRTLNSIIEAVLDSSTSGILAKRAIRDESGKIIDFEYTTVNRIAEVMFTMHPGTLKGKRLKTEFGAEGDAFYKYVEVVETSKTCQFEIYYKKTGRWYDVVGVKMMDGIVTTVTDITERKKAAEMLAKGYEELKNTSSKLEVTNTELERSNFDLLQFASVASHDLKEPLRKIQAFGNLLKERVKDKLEDGESNYLDKVISASNRMQVLVEDILTLSKLSHTQLPKFPTDLTEIVQKITEDLEIMIKEKNAEIKLEGLPTINAVPGQMHQLFQNLISNGLKFNEKEKPIICIKQVSISKELKLLYNIHNDEYVCIEVIDDGIGFEQQYADKIFGIFQRLDGNKYQGSGIGLAICKKIVEKHNGYIKAESVPGDGAKFIILLPK